MAIDPDLEQLLILRDLTDKTGMLHEAQVLQLKYLPLIMTTANKSEFTFSFKERAIIFNLTELKGKTPKNLLERLKHLSKCVKQILGEDYLVVIKINNKILFKSSQGVKNDRPKNNAKDRTNRTRKRKLSSVAKRRKR